MGVCQNSPPAGTIDSSQYLPTWENVMRHELVKVGVNRDYEAHTARQLAYAAQHQSRNADKRAARKAERAAKDNSRGLAVVGGNARVPSEVLCFF